MVEALLNDLATAVAKVEQRTQGRLKKTTDTALLLSTKLRRYGASASRGLSPIAKLIGLFGVPYADLAAKGLDRGADILGRDAKAKPLALQKAELMSGLRKLDHKFVVVIDDLDRLEPQEAAEVVRVVRAVGDFPKIVYLMCYERDVLAHSLQCALQVADGKAYLQKIVQASFAVPRPEEFDIRRWLLEECTKLYVAVTGKPLEDADGMERLAAVCDQEGAWLQTPRDIAQVLNALRLFYPPIAGQVDFPDMCWLQIVRLKHEELYKWVEEYLGVVAVLVGGNAHLNDSSRSALGERILKLMPDEEVSTAKSLWRLKDVIPGIEPGRNTAAKDRVLKNITTPVLGALEAKQRLGSPQHYRLYFSFTQPSGALNDATLREIVGAAEAGADVISFVSTLTAKKRPQGGTIYEVFLDRLSRLPPDQLNLPAGKKLLSAIADTVDEAQTHEPERGWFGRRMVWRHAHDMLSVILKRLSGSDRATFLSDLFTNGKSIGWLLAEVIGSELFAHGRAGDKGPQEDRQILTSAELDDGIAIMRQRLKGADRSKISSVPELLTFLYRWEQAGDEEEMKRWVAEQLQANDTFLALLENCRGWMASDRVYYPLKRRDISHLMDFDAAITRLQEIAANENAPTAHRTHAQELISAAEIDKDRG